MSDKVPATPGRPASGKARKAPIAAAVKFPPYKITAIGGLVPYARNARTHSEAQVAQIAASIREFGFTNPVLIDEAGGIIAGHGRVLAAQLLGMGDLPAITVAGLSAGQKRALMLADNKLALNAGWDADRLVSELDALDDEGFNLALTGFSSSELSELFAAQVGAVGSDPDEVPEVEAAVVSRLGDVWLLGDHRLVCGDCTSAASVALALEGAKPHLMVTDPPYGVRYDADWRNKALRADGTVIGGRAVGKVLNDHRSDWSAAWMLFPGSVAYVWHAGLFADVVMQGLRYCRFGLRAQIVWIKSRHVLGRGDYHPQHEPAIYAVREGADEHWSFVPEHEVASYAVKEGATGGYIGGRKQSTVWFIDHIKSETGHSTQKPVECMKRPMENNSKVGDAVYEPFSGSGTTIIAAEMTGRRCHAIELFPGYVDVAVRRWQKFTGRRATLQATGGTFAEVEAHRGAG